MTLSTSEQIVGILYYLQYHYTDPHMSNKGGIELNLFNDILPFDTPTKQLLESLMRQGLVEPRLDSGCIFYHLTTKGIDLVNKWDNKKKEEMRQFLQDRHYDPQPPKW